MTESFNPDHSEVVYVLVDWMKQHEPVSHEEADILMTAAVEVDSYVGRRYAKTRKSVVETALSAVIECRMAALSDTVSKTVYLVTRTDIETGKSVLPHAVERSA